MARSVMRVLVACEYSAIVREAFENLGCHAISCDILPTEGNEDFHYQGDVRDLLEEDWDLMVAHPPCTYLATSGIHWNAKRPERQEKTEEALMFVRELMNAPIKHIAIENPRSIISSRIRPADQMVHPFHFGEPLYKGIHLWLKNLPKLQHTNNVQDEAKQWIQSLPPSEDRAKVRSKFFRSVAEQMAVQWVAHIQQQTSLEDF